jgi:hypothetical protein
MGDWAIPISGHRLCQFQENVLNSNKLPSFASFPKREWIPIREELTGSHFANCSNLF